MAVIETVENHSHGAREHGEEEHDNADRKDEHQADPDTPPKEKQPRHHPIDDERDPLTVHLAQVAQLHQWNSSADGEQIKWL